MGIKRLWHFIWKDDSLLSWILSIIVAYVIVRYAIYPVLGLALGTSLPVVAVVSGSMEHNGLDFNSWWEQNNGWYENNGITKEQFNIFPLHNGFNKGDVIVIYGRNKVNIGDVVVYDTNGYRYPIIHRVISTEPISTKGDNNFSPDSNNLNSETIKGRAVFKVPYLGWIKIGFTTFIDLLRGGKNAILSKMWGNFSATKK